MCLNGSGIANLLPQARACVEALDAAIAELHNTTPHPRDFQLCADSLYHEARKEHNRRIEAITKIRGEMREYMWFLEENKDK